MFHIALKIYFIIFLSFQISALPSLPEIDTTLSKVNENLIYFQSNLQKRLKDLTNDTQNSIEALKSKNQAPNLVTQLENLQNLAQQFLTIDYFEKYENLSTCDDVNLKIIMMENDVQLYIDVIGKSNGNVSVLYPVYVQVNLQYASEFF